MSKGQEDFSEEEFSDQGETGGKQRRGFAAMPKEKQRAIASKGGRSSHGGGRRRQYESEEEGDTYQRRGGRGRGQESYDYDEDLRDLGDESDLFLPGDETRGFASMSKERQRAIASKGGRMSGKRRREEGTVPEGEFSEEEEYRRRVAAGGRGFASMPKRRVREISRKGREHGAAGFHPGKRSRHLAQFSWDENVRHLKTGPMSWPEYDIYSEGDESEEEILDAGSRYRGGVERRGKRASKGRYNLRDHTDLVMGPSDEELEAESIDYPLGRRGGASMSKDQLRRIGHKGGLSVRHRSHAGSGGKENMEKYNRRMRELYHLRGY